MGGNRRKWTVNPDRGKKRAMKSWTAKCRAPLDSDETSGESASAER